MGNTRFDAMQYRSYAQTNNLESKSRDEVFKSRKMPVALDPRNIVLRESCDSLANPNSTPLIFGLDVTGSMGFIAEAIAKRGLEPLMQTIYDDKPVSDPHVMFMGIGDVFNDQAPLQVSQFEAGAIPLIEQLRQLWLEGDGGGNESEAYDLPWYFAAHKTVIDSFEKRGKKGYLFTIGDELPPKRCFGKEHVKHVFGTGDLPVPESTAEVLAAAQQKFKVFHIVAEEGSFAKYQLARVRSQWTELLGPNVIFMRDHTKLAAIALATLKIAEGADIESVIGESDYKEDLRYAFANALNG